MSEPAPNEMDKQKWNEAERAHDLQWKAIETHAKQVEAFSVLGIRTLALTAAGGIAAVLGFYSANHERLSATAGTLDRLNGILGLLFGSMLLTLLTILLGYFSQVFFAALINDREMTYEHPYVRDTPKSNRGKMFGSICRYGSILAAVISAGFLVAAGLSFMGMVK